MSNVFCVRAEFGQYASAFKQGDYAAIGWLPKDDLGKFNPDNYEKLKALYSSHHSDDSPLSIGQNVGQIARFLFEINPGDIIVTPMFEYENLIVGKVTSDYYYETDHMCPWPHRKKVEWEEKTILRSTLSIPLQNTLRSSLAIYRISRGNEIAQAIGEKVPEKDIVHTETELYEQVLGRILELSSDEFEILVKDLLASIGFEAEHVGRTGDGGIDVTGNLKVYGLASIDLKVQVKRYSLNQKINAKVIRDFRGSVPEKAQGAFITTCGFQKKAYEGAIETGFKRIGLINGVQLVDILVDHYENISLDLQSKLRLRKTLVPST